MQPTDVTMEYQKTYFIFTLTLPNGTVLKDIINTENAIKLLQSGGFEKEVSDIRQNLITDAIDFCGAKP